LSIGDEEAPHKPIHLEITSGTDQLSQVRATVSEAALRLGFEEPDASAIALALHEVICNVITHAYDGRPGQPISLRIKPVRRDGCCGLEFTVRDRGRQVDPATIVGRDLADVRPGGLGIHIIRAVMDEVEYARLGEGGMQVRLLKLLKSPGDAETMPCPDTGTDKMAAKDNCVKEIRKEGSSVVGVLAGEMDLHHTPEVHQSLVSVCTGKPPRLVIDLAGVTYMDSSGIGTLVEIFRRVNAYGGRFILSGPTERVRSVFEITRLDRFFNISPSVAEALSA
jgi:anti-anti-sigma factor